MIRPFCLDKALSFMMLSFLYSLPGPWQTSQVTPSVLSSAAFSNNGAWQLRQSGLSAGFWTLACLAPSAAWGELSAANDWECLVPCQIGYCLPWVSVLWQMAHLAAHSEMKERLEME